MARCAYCDSDTNLYMNTVPVCRECDEHGYIPDKGTEANGQQPQTKTQSVAGPLLDGRSIMRFTPMRFVRNPPAMEECWRVSRRRPG